jgi:hypothetical protein
MLVIGSCRPPPRVRDACINMHAPSPRHVQVFNGFWGLDDARRNRDCLFVFGDNDARQGFAGQAVIRGEPNAIGLTTKRIPSHVAHAYYRCSCLFKRTISGLWHVLARPVRCTLHADRADGLCLLALNLFVQG